ncbi:hypothetical protein L6V77_12245 [Myxococcota bacterium]|nr:hypothetical protein [Myxococcota bacterium]
MRFGGPPTGRLAALAMALACGGCALPGDTLGVDDATIITVKTEIPLTAELPPLAVAPTDREISYAFTVAVPVDVVAELEKRGKKKTAKRLRENEDKLMGVSLDALEYAIEAPNRLPVQIDPVTVYIAPEDALVPDARARELGRTEVVGPHEIVASRPLTVTSTGLPDASEGLTSLHFALLFDAALRVPRAQAVPANALRAKIRLRLTARVDLAE